MILDPGPGRLCYNYRIQHPKLRGFFIFRSWCMATLPNTGEFLIGISEDVGQEHFVDVEPAKTSFLFGTKKDG